jgi:hypothetical protein
MMKDLECRVRRVVSEGFGGLEGNDLDVMGVEFGFMGNGRISHVVEMKGRWFKIRVSG